MTSYTSDEWTCIRRARDRRFIRDAALVLTAVDIGNHMEFDATHWCLYVDPRDADRAGDELEYYRIENQMLSFRKPEIATIDSGWFGVIGYLLVIWLLPFLQANSAVGWAWNEIGAMQAGLVRAGEWWRTITALTLHADLGHIVGNSAFGALFGVLVGRNLGSGLGWLLILLGGAMGNGLNAWLQADSFRSIGASTATFAALGLVAAFVWRRGAFRGRRWRRNFAPIFAGIALLAYTGVGDENTDVVAHFVGFAVGALMGVTAARLDVERFGVAVQRVCGAVALALVALAWSLASRSGG